ncbi:hypothetical protein CRENPOLYSF2_1210006 [Crenothrix polyspora]|uniref:Uncharacterized protein n=1 Tax=Crenothrix polyspora TaxID=360316 RepID=A0A1R4H036_9GAMM|nr:hypothetical protein CRENPOLYSF2_1210006 [Crenothrix polyspora]
MLLPGLVELGAQILNVLVIIIQYIYIIYIFICNPMAIYAFCMIIGNQQF